MLHFFIFSLIHLLVFNGCIIKYIKVAKHIFIQF